MIILIFNLRQARATWEESRSGWLLHMSGGIVLMALIDEKTEPESEWEHPLGMGPGL